MTRMNTWQMLFCTILIALRALYCTSERSYFRAAVFENTPATVNDEMSHAEIIISNLKLIEIAAKEAAERGADIFVSSEYGLNPPGLKIRTKGFAVNIPDPRKTTINPCDAKSSKEFEDALSSLSCIAKKNNMYVVGNILDTHPCSSDSQTCSADGENCGNAEECIDGYEMYNTNVAFNRNGDLIARYHKNNLYFEFLDTPRLPEVTTFQTEFGIFGMIVCFDSVFKNAIHLVKDHNVETLLFPTHWFDDILPLNAIEWQQAWAFTNNVNFLAANKHVPGNATFGSGIYSKHFGALAYTYNPDGKSKLVISNVPRDESIIDFDSKVLVIEENEVTEINEKGEHFLKHCHVDLMGPPNNMLQDHRCYKVQTSQHTLKKLEKKNDEIEACHNKFCCTLKYEAESMNEDYYLTAFSGENDVYNHFKWNEQTCLLVRCDPFEDKFCAAFPSKSTTVFKSVEMKAKFNSEYVYPTVSTSHHRLAPKPEWTLQKEDEYHVLSFYTETSEPLLKIGLFARNYAKDPAFIPYYRTVKDTSRF